MPKTRKAVYQNPKSGKFYAIEGSGEEAVFVTVYISNALWTNKEHKVDKSGKEYIVLELEEYVTKNGYVVYRG